MKKFSYHCYALLIAALACAGLSGCQTSGTAGPWATASVAAPAGQNVAQLIIRRAPNMGAGVVLDVKTDGTSVRALAGGEIYMGSVSPRQHTVAALLRQIQLHQLPTT